MRSEGNVAAQDMHLQVVPVAQVELAFTARAEGWLCTRKITGQGVVIRTITLEHPLCLESIPKVKIISQVEHTMLHSCSNVNALVH
jgi:hypothetical protein